MSEHILDASALIAVFLQEREHEVIARLKGAKLMSSVNLAEVTSRLVDLGYTDDAVAFMIQNANVDFITFDAEQAFLSGQLRAQTRHKGLSLGDRACLALGMVRGAKVYTADQAWAELDLPVDVVLVR
jgi:ribonuclease VapC